MQNQIKKKHNLLDSHGNLISNGWCSSQKLQYKRRHVCRHPLRLRERDCYYISGRKCALYISVSDDTVTGSVSAVLVDFEDGTVKKRTLSRLFPLGRMKMPDNPDSGTTIFSDSHCGVSFVSAGNRRFIKCDFVDFYNGENLYINITLEENIKNSLYVSKDLPMSGGGFMYNCFKPGMTANGVIHCGGSEYILNGNRTYAFLNWSRAVPAKNYTRQVLFANNYLTGQKQFALCLSDAQSKYGKVTDNAVFYSGNINKLENVGFTTKTENPLAMRHISDVSHSLDICFKPLEGKHGIIRATLPDRLVIFGKIEGEIFLDDDRNISLSRLPAILELEGLR